MKGYLITFRSITLAQRAQASLEREGVRCRLRRTPRWMEERGCGYAVEARLAALEQGTSVLKRESILWRKVYRLTEDGMEEVS